MGDVKVTLNGKNFRDYGVRVSDYIGLFDSLKRKEISNYNWSEYHGLSVNLKNPKYQERDFELKCFIEGNNWKDMFVKFNTMIRDEFYKSGTQRLVVDPFGISKLPYEVYLKDEIKLDKTFKDGKMVGVFSIKMIEPNPLKIILKTSLDSFKLSYESTTETEIFFGDGTKQTARGNVNFTKDYDSPSYESSGINTIAESGINNDFYEAFTIPTEKTFFRFSVDAILPSAKNIMLIIIGRKPNNTYAAVSVSNIVVGKTGYNSLEAFTELNMSDYGKFIYKVLDSDGNEISNLTYGNAKVETGEIIGEWQDMIGKEKIIIIAGNIEEIKNLQTEAEVLWDKI